MSNQKPKRGDAKLFASWDVPRLRQEQASLEKSIQSAVDSNNHNLSKRLSHKLDLVCEALKDKGLTEEEISPVEDDITW